MNYFQNNEEPEENREEEATEEENVIDTPNLMGGDICETITRLRLEGYNMDDENEPNPVKCSRGKSITTTRRNTIHL